MDWASFGIGAAAGAFLVGFTAWLCLVRVVKDLTRGR